MKSEEHPHARSLNVLRDLPHVADLIELCFNNTMDGDGQRYLSDMRRASRDDGFLRWANHMAESTSLPLTGYVWEENGKIIGNASLIPFRDRGKRIYLVANIATHPDHRRRGIARLLTQRVVEHARKKNAAEIWLHVRDDNPGAVQLYADLGFREIARRTTWQASPDSRLDLPDLPIQITERHPRFWIQQQDWLRRLYPSALNWYSPLNLSALQPGLLNWLYWLFMDFDLRQWAAVHGETLLAILTWMPRGRDSESIYLATAARPEAPQAASPDQRHALEMPYPGLHTTAVTQLLFHVRRTLANHAPLTLELPAGEMTEAIAAAGFKLRRTLIWMKM